MYIILYNCISCKLINLLFKNNLYKYIKFLSVFIYLERYKKKVKEKKII